MTTTFDSFKRAPKVELHLHLEGAIPQSTLLALVAKYDAEPMTAEQLAAKFAYRDFHSFIENFFWMMKHFREADDYENLAYDVLKDMSVNHNVLYAEIFYSPNCVYDQKTLTVAMATEALLRGKARAQQEFGIEANFILDVERHTGAEWGMQQLDQVEKYIGKGLIGIGLGGPEVLATTESYRDVYREARRRGLRTTIHAGESAGPESVWASLRTLEVTRIGHGVRSVEDPELVTYLRDNKIVLEVCPTSNVRTGTVPSLAEHPIAALLAAGVQVTINTDDPTFFNCDLSGEYAALHKTLGWSVQTLREVALNAARGTWLDETAKAALIQRVASGWDAFIQSA